MGKLDCLIAKNNKIQGNDIAAIMGIDNYRSIANVYREKTEGVENSPEVVETKYWTNTLEELVSKEFVLRTRKQVRKSNINLVDKEYDFMVSDVNRKIVGENSILDCIVINKIEEDLLSGEISKKYILKAQHDMRIKKADRCYIAILMNDEKFILKEIKRDEKLISRIIKLEEKFWKNYIKKNVKPKKALCLEN